MSGKRNGMDGRLILSGMDEVGQEKKTTHQSQSSYALFGVQPSRDFMYTHKNLMNNNKDYNNVTYIHSWGGGGLYLESENLSSNLSIDHLISCALRQIR